MARLAWVGLLAATCVAAPACSTPDGAVELVTGGETDTFTRAPRPTSITVEALESGGGRTTIYSGPVGGTIDLGERSRSDVRAFAVTAKDDAGIVRVRGRSLAVELGALEVVTLPIFVQRVGETARAPGTFDAGREAPILDLVQGRYLLVAGGGLTSVFFYDTLRWTQAAATPTLPRPPESLAVVEAQLLTVAGAAASVYDLAGGTSADVTAPAGTTFASVAGGRTVYAPDGTAYVVGATRASGEPTTAILKIATDGALSFANLSAPRLGAAATWVDGRGVVVVGGSGTAPGVEILPINGAQGTALPYPPDASTGLAAATLDAQRVVISGVETRIADLACTNACTLQAWAKHPTATTQAEPFVLDGQTGAVWVLGAGADGTSHLFRVAPDRADEIPLKGPHKRARGIVASNGQLLLTGGGAGVEGFIP